MDKFGHNIPNTLSSKDPPPRHGSVGAHAPTFGYKKGENKAQIAGEKSILGLHSENFHGEATRTPWQPSRGGGQFTTIWG